MQILVQRPVKFSDMVAQKVAKILLFAYLLRRDTRREPWHVVPCIACSFFRMEMRTRIMWGSHTVLYMSTHVAKLSIMWQRMPIVDKHGTASWKQTMQMRMLLRPLLLLHYYPSHSWLRCVVAEALWQPFSSDYLGIFSTILGPGQDLIGLPACQNLPKCWTTSSWVILRFQSGNMPKTS